MNIVEISKEDVLSVVKNSKSPEDFIVNIHRKVIGEQFDKVDKLNGYVRCTKETIDEISIMLQAQFKESFGMAVMFTWMNWGFGISKTLTENYKFDISEALPKEKENNV